MNQSRRCVWGGHLSPVVSELQMSSVPCTGLKSLPANMCPWTSTQEALAQMTVPSLDCIHHVLASLSCRRRVNLALLGVCPGLALAHFSKTPQHLLALFKRALLGYWDAKLAGVRPEPLSAGLAICVCRAHTYQVSYIPSPYLISFYLEGNRAIRPEAFPSFCLTSDKLQT